MSSIRNIVIIGGGQAAGWAAKTLRGVGFDGRLSVVAEEAYDFYERPPLSKAVLAGQQEPDDLRLFKTEEMDQLRLDWHRPRRATQVDRTLRQVRLDDGSTLAYDRLLIATGSRPRVPDPAWLRIDGVMVLRDVADALALRQRLAACRALAVIGGGWIGLEVAALARTLGIAVAVYERAPTLCGRSAGADVAAHLATMHRAKGVLLHLDCGELALSGRRQGGVAINAAGRIGVYDTVLVGAGAQLNVELAQQADLRMHGGGIVVDGAGRTSDPAVFAAGDVAAHPAHGVCVQSWSNAQNQAIAAAHGMLDRPADYRDVPWLWSDQYDVNIQILGLRPVEGRCVRRGGHDGRDIYFYLDGDARLRQMVAFGDARAIKLGRRWMEAERVLDPAALADPDFDLMSLR